MEGGRETIPNSGRRLVGLSPARIRTNDDEEVPVQVETSVAPNGGLVEADGLSSNQTDKGKEISKGLTAILANVITDFDSRVEDAVSSQNKLSFSLDRLCRELDQLLEDAPVPFIMQHASRLCNVRKRVSSLNSHLRSIQRRVDNIDQMLSSGKQVEEVYEEARVTIQKNEAKIKAG